MNLKTPLLIFKICLVVSMILVAVVLVSGVYSGILFLMPQEGEEGNGGGNGGDNESDEGGMGLGFMTFPEEGDLRTTISGDVVTFSAPIEFHNNGFLPIENFYIDMEMRFQDKVLFSGHNVVGTLAGGSSKESQLTYQTDISELMDQGLGAVFYQDLQTEMKVAIHATYLYDWIVFDMELEMDNNTWEAPVNISIDEGAVYATPVGGGNVDVTVPVSVDTADWLSDSTVTGLIAVQAPSIASGTLGSTPVNMMLGNNNDFDLTFTLSPSEFQQLSNNGGNLEITGDIVLTVAGTDVPYTLYENVDIQGGMI